MLRIHNKITFQYFQGTIYRTCYVKNKSTRISETSELAQAYVPRKLEHFKKSNNYFRPRVKNSEPFTLVLPPPNITGTLHLGHALTATVQDVIVRWKQMQGFETVWVPGMDHAGIATQMVVEKLLWKEFQHTRHDIGREKFLKKVLEWKTEKSGVIEDQLRGLGVLLDWEKEIFTLDEQRCKAVQEAFIKLFEAGLIYRANSLVNWSCLLKSAISDIEVEQLCISGSTNITVPGYNKPVEFGILTKFAYLVDGSNEEIVVATTRPETMLGDVAVAVHPEDQRYSKFIGVYLKHPFRTERIPVIADSFVDRKFGTGAVKITPAHDFTDFDVGKRHSLDILAVIGEDGRMTEECGKFADLPRFEARQVITEQLDRLNLLRGREEHPMTIPICSRSKDVIEFLIRPQWFVKCNAMAAEAVHNVKEGRLSIEPKGMEKTWFLWLENIKDWCISRQLWWGHQVPAYLCSSTKTDKTTWVAAENEHVALKKGASKLGLDLDDLQIKRDEDVLDTWFSSALLPFAAFGWPEKTEDLTKYYPLSLMETGHDILFFWVARMVMLGTELTGKLPFNKILLHGIICDAYGRKMSKSLGNVIAPEDIIKGVSLENMKKNSETNFNLGIISKEEHELSIQGQKKMFPTGIPECGSDALRYTLMSHNIKSVYINFDISECYTNKLFCNKIWQATRFTKLWFSNISIQQNLDSVSFDNLSIVDKWILSRLTVMTEKVNDGMEQFDFSQCTYALKNFLYYEFCDIYLETTKRGLRELDSKIAVGHLWTLVTCLDVGLRLLAPFMPVLSEHLFSHLPLFPGQEKLLEFPHKLNWTNKDLEKNIDELMDVVVAIRRLKKTFNISVKTEPKINVISPSKFLTNYSSIIKDLTGFQNIDVSDKLFQEFPKGILKDKVGNTFIYIAISSDVKKSLHLDLERMKKKKEKLQKELEKMLKMVSGSTYRVNATLENQELHSKKITVLKEQISRLDYFQNIFDG